MPWHPPVLVIAVRDEWWEDWESGTCPIHSGMSRVYYLPQHRTLSIRHPLALCCMRSTGCWVSADERQYWKSWSFFSSMHCLSLVWGLFGANAAQTHPSISDLKAISMSNITHNMLFSQTEINCMCGHLAVSESVMWAFWNITCNLYMPIFINLFHVIYTINRDTSDIKGAVFQSIYTKSE